MDKRRIKDIKTKYKTTVQKSAHPLWQIHHGDHGTIVNRTEPEQIERHEQADKVEVTAAPTEYELRRDRWLERIKKFQQDKQRTEVRKEHTEVRKERTNKNKRTQPDTTSNAMPTNTPDGAVEQSQVKPPASKTQPKPPASRPQPSSTAVQPLKVAPAPTYTDDQNTAYNKYTQGSDKPQGLFQNMVQRLVGPKYPSMKIPPLSQLRTEAIASMPSPADVNKIFDEFIKQNPEKDLKDKEPEITQLRQSCIRYAMQVHEHRLQYIEYLIRNIADAKSKMDKDTAYMKLDQWVRRQHLNEEVSRATFRALNYLRDNSHLLVRAEIKVLDKLAAQYKEAAGEMRRIIHILELMEERGFDISNQQKVINELGRHKNGKTLQQMLQRAIKSAGTYADLLDDVAWARDIAEQEDANMAQVTPALPSKPIESPHAPTPSSDSEDYGMAQIQDEEPGTVTDDEWTQLINKLPKPSLSRDVTTEYPPKPQIQRPVSDADREQLRMLRDYADRLEKQPTPPPPAQTMDDVPDVDDGRRVPMSQQFKPQLQPKPAPMEQPAVEQPVQPPTPPAPQPVTQIPPVITNPVVSTPPTESIPNPPDSVSTKPPDKGPNIEDVQRALEKLRPHVEQRYKFKEPGEQTPPPKPMPMPTEVPKPQWQRKLTPLEQDMGLTQPEPEQSLDIDTDPNAPSFIPPDVISGDKFAGEWDPDEMMFILPDDNVMQWVPEYHMWRTIGGAEDDWMTKPGTDQKMQFGSLLSLPSKDSPGRSVNVLILSPVAQASGKGYVPAFIGQRIFIPQSFSETIKDWQANPPTDAEGNVMQFPNAKAMKDEAIRVNTGVITGYAPDKSGDVKSAWLRVYMPIGATLWIQAKQVEEDKYRGVASGHQHPRMESFTPKKGQQQQDTQTLQQPPMQTEQPAGTNMTIQQPTVQTIGQPVSNVSQPPPVANPAGTAPPNNGQMPQPDVQSTSPQQGVGMNDVNQNNIQVQNDPSGGVQIKLK